MEVTIEEIDGKKWTVIWNIGHDPVNLNCYHYIDADNGLGVREYIDSDVCHLATVLPALPKYPKQNHQRLLYRYCAEGLVPVDCTNNDDINVNYIGTVYCLDLKTWEKVRVAIDE